MISPIDNYHVHNALAVPGIRFEGTIWPGRARFEVNLFNKVTAGCVTDGETPARLGGYEVWTALISVAVRKWIRKGMEEVLRGLRVVAEIMKMSGCSVLQYDGYEERRRAGCDEGSWAES